MNSFKKNIKLKLFLCLGILFFTSFIFSFRAYSEERHLRTAEDSDGEGTLRTFIRELCRLPGDDQIVFSDLRASVIPIVLHAPLVIPQDCQGTITIDGPSDKDVILDSTHVYDDPCLTSSEGCLLHRTDGRTYIDLLGIGRTYGDSCMLNIYSDHHVIRNTTWIGNIYGAGICLFGRDNHIEGNRFGKTLANQEFPNRYGVLVSDAFRGQFSAMDGSGNIITNNQMTSNSQHGLWIHANGNTIQNNVITDSTQNSGAILFGDQNIFRNNQVFANQGNGVYLQGSHFQIEGNQITSNGGHGIYIQGSESTIRQNQIFANGGCPAAQRFPSDQFVCISSANHGAGIFVAAGSNHITIGGPSFDQDRNIIQYNHDGGVILEGDATTIQNTITHNTISNNYGVNVDLGNDEITLNDLQDTDEGPNHLLNFTDTFQAFPLVPSLDGSPRYWAWGVARSGDHLEVYQVSSEEQHRQNRFGGGNSFVADVPAMNRNYEVSPQQLNTLHSGDWFTLLSFDAPGNTSEYSRNYPVGPDEDMDAVIDTYETGDGTPGTTRSNPHLVDSDGDDLPDSVEDRNRNGVWDPTERETKAFDADTDHDRLSDWAETHGDGIYDVGIDTDPFNPDTDGDGISDGREDQNGNGIWEAYRGETSPLRVDSDGDGILDNQDNCPVIPNHYQEPWFCGL